MQKHTPEPWIQDNISKDCFSGDNGYMEGQVKAGTTQADIARQKADCARIVACVNACTGLNPTAIPEMVKHYKEMLAYIEMKMAHNGCLSVAQIMDNLKHDIPRVSEVETSHHLGCAQTTRRVHLDAARSALASLSNQDA